jgi:hypothetical protein
MGALATPAPGERDKLRSIARQILAAVVDDEPWPEPAQSLRLVLGHNSLVMFEMLIVGLCQLVCDDYDERTTP